jgi:DNA-binding MarR family transcriptional regulator
VTRTASPSDLRSVQVAITAVGRELIDQAHADFEAEIAVLMADVNPAQRTRLFATASRIVAAYARQRGINIFSVEPNRG